MQRPQMFTLKIITPLQFELFVKVVDKLGKNSCKNRDYDLTELLNSQRQHMP